MELMLVWPETWLTCTLSEQCSPEQPLWFCPEQGTFSTQASGHERDCVLFYWLFSLPVMVNLSRDYLCRAGEKTLEFGQARPLLPGMEIQVGQFRLQTQQAVVRQAMTEAQAKRVFSAALLPGAEMPEPDDLLPDIGHYMAWQPQPPVAGSEENPLKALAGEYKNVVLWGEQRRDPGPTSERVRHRDAGEGGMFMAQREHMASRTVTDCILDTPNLMERVCEELDLTQQRELLLDEESKQDILLLLAPAHLQRVKPAHQLPSLMLQEFYKTGLDTQL
ncbi:TagK domain-containing protein [Siccibacter colletis]|uniref:TagK domain-containing protein n=1 Tax=Siccibacter colletis TaxID=1505757 RepID=UPI0028BECA23|nr:TagK domain-containing protein [Siccibacter colletis]WNN47906.1 TagK domain-containing protein [Siccibacter colletis]